MIKQQIGNKSAIVSEILKLVATENNDKWGFLDVAKEEMYCLYD
ncbi:MAG: hypothetical protein E6767_17600 [Dysgonomonas sp.]|nr:hypothetical protein [Dysgonomonas sp.]